MSVVKEKYRVSFAVPATSGSYAPERIAFGEVASGMPEDTFQGVTALVEGSVTAMVVELWLPRIGATHPKLDTDYFNTGKFLNATGGETWALAGYPGAELRIKSGGTAGTAILNASAF